MNSWTAENAMERALWVILVVGVIGGLVLGAGIVLLVRWAFG